MNWEAIGAIGEVIGAAGVVTTLVYLTFQIRENTASVRASTYQSMSEASVQFFDAASVNPEIGRIAGSGFRDLTSLTPEERTQFFFIMSALFRRFENFHHQATHRRVSEEDWAGLRESLLRISEGAGSRAWWSENSRRYNPSFVNWLNCELQQRAGQQADEPHPQ